MRNRAQQPLLTADSNLLRYPERFRSYLNDNFGLRDELIRLNSAIKFYIFGVSASKKVHLGKDGWMFYRPNQLDDFQGKAPLSKKSLRTWENVLRYRQDYIASKGIKYLFVIAPNKSTIYPGQVIYPRKRSRREQLLSHLQENNGVKVLDLTPLLLDKKKENLIYWKTDTHWNHEGAYYSLLEILDNLDVSITANPSITNLKKNLENRSFGLATMLSLDGILTETYTSFLPKQTCAKTNIENRNEHGLKNVKIVVREIRRTKCRNKKKKAIVIHDSFFQIPRIFLSEEIGEVLYYWIGLRYPQNWLEFIIEKESPDFIIEERVERILKNTPSVARDTNQNLEKLFNSYETKVTILDKDTPPKKFFSSGNTQFLNSRWIIKAEKSPIIILPLYPIQKCTRKILRVVMERDNSSPPRVFYKTGQEQKKYHKDRQFRFKSSQNQKIFFANFGQTDFIGRLRFDPGTKPGTFHIKSISMAFQQLDKSVC